MAEIYCATCFEICTGDEPVGAQGICRYCGQPIITVARDPCEHAVPMTRELGTELRAHEAGMLRHDGLEED